ncbi:MAG: hypothetical protein ABIM89_18610 [Mycobacteriales bacterium]
MASTTPANAGDCAPGTGAIDRAFDPAGHGAKSPEEAARSESQSPYTFPAGDVRLVEGPSRQGEEWRQITVYRGAQMLRQYDLQPLTDGSWVVHRASVTC